MVEVELLYGATLESISLGQKHCRITFFKSHRSQKYVLAFSGLVVTTRNFSPKHTVEIISIGILGFRTLTEVLHKRWNPNEYKQLFIKLNNNNSGEKIELIAAVKDLKLIEKKS